MCQTVGDLAWTALSLLLFQSVDQFHGREEPDPLMVMLDGLDTERSGNVRLARAGTADQNDVVGVVKEIAAVELLHESLVDLAACEVEAIQITVGRKACRLELVSTIRKRTGAVIFRCTGT